MSKKTNPNPMEEKELNKEIKGIMAYHTTSYQIDDLDNPGSELTVEHVPEGMFRSLEHDLAAFVDAKVREARLADVERVRKAYGRMDMEWQDDGGLEKELDAIEKEAEGK